MTVLVTGGGGFLGLYVVEQLRARGDEVRVFCRHRHERLEELGVDWHQGDVRDAEAVTAACEGIETVIHCAALPGIWGPWQRYYQVNTVGTQHVIDGGRRTGVRRLVHTSSPSVVFDGTDHDNADETLPYPDRFECHYARSKAVAEREVLAANGLDGLATVVLRPHLIWGPRDNHLVPRLINRARRGRLRQVGDGTNHVSMSYVENAAAALVQAGDLLEPDAPHAGRAYFINEPDPVNLWEWINRLLETAGLPPVTRQVSAGTARRVGAVLEAAWWLFRLPGEPPMTRFLADQLSRTHCYSISRAEADFGYRKIVPADEGLRRLEPELKRLAGDD